MPEEQTAQSFGQYLQAARLKAGKDLDYVSSETKISPDMLRAIEKEDYGRLPEPVYVIGFIRSFASVVGADAEWALRDYARKRELYVDMRQSESEHAIRGSSGYPRLLIVVAVAALVAVVAYFGYSYYRNHFGGGPSATTPAVERSGVAGQGAESPAGDISKADVDEFKTEIMDDAYRGESAESEQGPGDEETEAEEPAPAVPATGSGPPYELAVEATEDTWMKIMVDGQNTKEYNLKPGDKIVVEADSKYNILIGNAGGVKMDLNDKPLPSPGKSGQVVNIELP
jgi:cytoskeletal protein RodZ